MYLPLSNAHDEAQFTSLCHLYAPYAANTVDWTQLHSPKLSSELPQPLFQAYCRLQTNAFDLDTTAFSFTAVFSIKTVFASIFFVASLALSPPGPS
jgi:hypothetical protein